MPKTQTFTVVLTMHVRAESKDEAREFGTAAFIHLQTIFDRKRQLLSESRVFVIPENRA